jgi:phospholipase/carboxylesterase
VIWLHGLGADGHDFEPLVPMLGLPRRLAVRFVFPHAPERPVTINNGVRMRAWYDIVRLGGGVEDSAGIRDSQALLEGLIARERGRGIEAGRIVLAGFSQGGAIALHTGLRHAERLAGILEAERSRANADVPIFLAHGLHDELIGIERALSSRDALEALGYAPDWHEYPMAHAVCEEEVTAIAGWLATVL